MARISRSKAASPFEGARWPHRNPLLLYAPFLLLYVAIVLVLHRDALQGDEGRYLSFARNLVHGFYSPPAPDINLWNGPGYPLLLVPFVVLRLPLLSVTLLNAVLQYGSVVLLHKALAEVASPRAAVLFGLLWACYYPAFQELPLMVTEPLVAALVAALAYLLTRTLKGAEPRHTIGAGLVLGYLCLTKVIFCYVILAMAPLAATAWLRNRRSPPHRAAVALIVVAFVVLAPYGLYTWRLTGRVFYWANSGGTTIYWMSTPFDGEYGDWNNDTLTAHCTENLAVPCENEHLWENHRSDIQEIDRFTGVARDDAFRRLALRNIRSHPGKYLANCMANVGRMFFGFPATWTYQRVRTLVRIPAGALLAILLLACLPPTVLGWRRLELPVRFAALFGGIYLGVSTLVSAYPRQLNAIVPLLLLWIAAVSHRTISVRFRLDD